MFSMASSTLLLPGHRKAHSVASLKKIYIHRTKVTLPPIVPGLTTTTTKKLPSVEQHLTVYCLSLT